MNEQQTFILGFQYNIIELPLTNNFPVIVLCDLHWKRNEAVNIL